MQLHLQTGFKLLGLVQGKIVKRLNLFWIVLSLRAFVFLKKSFALVFSHPVVLHPPFRSILRGSGKGQLGGSASSFYPQQAVITGPPFPMTCSPPLCSPNIPVQLLQISRSQW